MDVAFGVPETTQPELSVKPDGSDGELLHEVGNPLPLTIVGESEFMVWLRYRLIG